MDKIAIMIPCYNEEKTIGKVVRDFREYLPDAVIYVYDNNSKDNTAALAEEAGAIVRREYKQGKGNVIRRMFREINANCYIMADGDDTYPAEYAPKIAKAILEGRADMVVGDRLSSTYFTENKRIFHNSGNRIVRDSINFLFGTNMRDIMTGYRGFSYQFIKSFPVLSKGFEIETEMTIHAIDKNMLIEHITVDYRDRPEGSVSKLNTIRDGFKVLKTIAVLLKNYRPLMFFSIIAAFLLAAGTILAFSGMSVFFDTGSVAGCSDLFFCLLLWLAALQSFFSGVVLDVVKHKNRHDFEMLLHEIEHRKTLIK